MFDGSIIKKLRNEMNLNQSELAEKVGCTQANISSYETNRTRPDIDILVNLAKVFNKSVDYLLGLSTLDMDSLSENEQYIITTYRALREDNKIQFMTMTNMIKTLRDIQKKNLG